MFERKACPNCTTGMTVVTSKDKDGAVFARRLICAKCGNREVVHEPKS